MDIDRTLSNASWAIGVGIPQRDMQLERGEQDWLGQTRAQPLVKKTTLFSSRQQSDIVVVWVNKTIYYLKY